MLLVRILVPCLSTARNPGLTRRELIVLIVALVVIVLAGVCITSFFVGKRGFQGNWQCLDCGYIFSRNTYETPPIECPKCQGQAVQLIYRQCPKCKKENLVWRLRLTEEARALLANLKAQNPDGTVDFETIAHLPNEVQCLIKNSGGKPTWTQEWLSLDSTQSREIRDCLHCTKCGAKLFGRNR